MITDKEIITNQVNRINEKSNLNVSARKINVLWYLYQEGYLAPLNTSEIGRTADQLIEYLAGMEDAIDYINNVGLKNDPFND